MRNEISLWSYSLNDLLGYRALCRSDENWSDRPLKARRSRASWRELSSGRTSFRTLCWPRCPTSTSSASKITTKPSKSFCRSKSPIIKRFILFFSLNNVPCHLMTIFVFTDRRSPTIHAVPVQLKKTNKKCPIRWGFSSISSKNELFF